MSDPNAQQLLAPPKQGLGGAISRIRQNLNPTPTFLLGLWMSLVWFILSMLDIETSEALLLHEKVATFSPDWSIILQIPQIIAGQPMPIDVAKAAMVGWTLELCTLVSMVGFDLALEAVKNANYRLVEVFGAGVIICAIIDFWANLVYGPTGSTFPEQVLFSFVITFGTFFFGVPGFYLMSHAWKTWKQSY